MTRSILIGHAFESFDKASAKGMQLVADLGADFVRYWLWGSDILERADRCEECADFESAPQHSSATPVHPFRPTYNWARVDHDLAVMIAAGLDVYVDLMWLPACVTGGLPTLLPYGHGCTINDSTDPRGWRYADRCGWADRDANSTVPCGHGASDQRHVPPPPHTLNDGTVIDLGFGCMAKHPFKPERPECLPPNIPAASASMVRAFAIAFALRYKHLFRRRSDSGPGIRWGGGWNEPDGAWYFPKMYNPPGGWQSAYDALRDEIIIPWTEGLRSIITWLPMIGIEGASPGAMAFGLTAEKASGKSYINIPSYHAYGEGGAFPESSYARLPDFRKVLDEHGNGREEWIGEVGDDGGGNLDEWFRGMIERNFNGASAVVLYATWFKPGTWEADAPITNDHYSRMKVAIQNYRESLHRRRRAARH